MFGEEEDAVFADDQEIDDVDAWCVGLARLFWLCGMV